MVLAIVAGVAGSLGGALFNYYLAKRYGRKGVLTFGKYFFFNEIKLQKMEAFFIKHGSFSTFVSRLIPGIRQLISLPAGLSKMPLRPFALYTTLGAGIWVVILVILGFYLGSLEQTFDSAKPFIPQLITASKPYVHQIVYIALGIIAVATFAYISTHRRKHQTQI